MLAVAVAGVALVAVAFGAARLIAPHRPLPAKLTTYECGIDPVGEGWAQSEVRYYIYGFLFVIFDVEIALTFPVAVVFRAWKENQYGWIAFAELMVFVFILLAGLAYVWKKGDLEWIKQLKKAR